MKAYNLILLCSVCIGLFANESQAQNLYAYKSASGSITFSSRKPKKSSYWTVSKKEPRRSVIVVRRGLGYESSKKPKASDYDSLIIDYAKEFKLEAALIKAIMHVESAFNPKARSHAGARGLMQLMPPTAQRFGVKNMYDPEESLTGGVKYLRWLFDKFDGNLKHVLAGYNAGEGAVLKYRGIPPYLETQQYVKRVLSLARSYRCDFSGLDVSCTK